ncbi:DEAD-box ATP-dependent RNA helicase CshA [compost metagenome]
MAEAVEGKQRLTAERLLEIVQSGELNEYKGIAIQMLEQYDSVQLLSAALKLLTGDKKDAQVDLTPEDPIRAKRRKPDVRSGGRKPSGYSGNRTSGSGGSGGGYNRDRNSSGGGRGGYNRDRNSGSSTGGGSREGGYNRDRKPRPSNNEGRRPAKDSSFE